MTSLLSTLASCAPALAGGHDECADPLRYRGEYRGGKGTYSIQFHTQQFFLGVFPVGDKKLKTYTFDIEGIELRLDEISPGRVQGLGEVRIANSGGGFHEWDVAVTFRDDGSAVSKAKISVLLMAATDEDTLSEVLSVAHLKPLTVKSFNDPPAGCIGGDVAVASLQSDWGWIWLEDGGQRLEIQLNGHAFSLDRFTAGKTAPQVAISAPAANTQVAIGDVVTFDAQVTDDDPLSDEWVFWCSDRTGFLGTGRTLSTDFQLGGEHEIRCTAVDRDGLRTFDAVMIDVPGLTPSTPVILQPSPAAVGFEGVSWLFDGYAYDVETGPLTGPQLRWSSDVDGSLGTGEQFKAPLSVGAHTITLTANDGAGGVGGLESSQSVQVSVQPYAGTSPPRVSIEQPRERTATFEGLVTSFIAGSIGSLLFEGRAEDHEDAATDLTLEWFLQLKPTPSDPNPPFVKLGEGGTVLLPASAFRVASDSKETDVGTVTFRATDTDGLSAEVEMRVVFFGGGFTIL